jgi:hypothetical protein
MRIIECLCAFMLETGAVAGDQYNVGVSVVGVYG